MCLGPGNQHVLCYEMHLQCSSHACRSATLPLHCQLQT